MGCSRITVLALGVLLVAACEEATVTGGRAATSNELAAITAALRAQYQIPGKIEVTRVADGDFFAPLACGWADGVSFAATLPASSLIGPAVIHEIGIGDDRARAVFLLCDNSFLVLGG